MTVVVIDTGRLREPIEQAARKTSTFLSLSLSRCVVLPEEIFESIAMQVIFANGQNDSIGCRQCDFSGDAERRVRVDKGHQSDSTAFAYFTYKHA